MLKFLDIFFVIFHTTLILFNLFGWIWKPTRKANLITLSLTFLAWFGLGIFYGIGYCPVTDWHWNVLNQLGQTDLPNSYISYLVLRISGIKPNDTIVDVMTMSLFLIAFGSSIFLNIRDMKEKRRMTKNSIKN